MIELVIPFPPTVNSLWRNYRGRSILSASYRKWREFAAVQIDFQMRNRLKIEGPYHMVIELDRPDKRARDVSNYAKAVEDSLVLCGVIRDDSDAVSLMLKWSEKKPGKGAMAKVEIEPA